jgi:hypothetical protein
VYSSATQQSFGPGHGSELGYSVLEAPDSALDTEMIEKFQASFAFDDKERLLGCMYSSPSPPSKKADDWQIFLATSSVFFPYLAVSTFRAIIYAFDLVDP